VELAQIVLLSLSRLAMIVHQMAFAVNSEEAHTFEIYSSESTWKIHGRFIISPLTGGFFHAKIKAYNIS
jgi:hypothetical protein